ncbi:MAG TPA: 50S ribosomal protein L18 [Catalimonadaceae bacterium]|nr:50S ribosomal protein L18 [Catalimonadaceae bacterium]
MALTKLERRKRIQLRIRKKIRGSAERPRISVFRSNSQIYAQLIDDVAGKTITAASSLEVKSASTSKTETAGKVGQALASKAKEAGITNVIFDRSGYLYHGRVKALAEGAREGGLNF